MTRAAARVRCLSLSLCLCLSLTHTRCRQSEVEKTWLYACVRARKHAAWVCMCVRARKTWCLPSCSFARVACAHTRRRLPWNRTGRVDAVNHLGRSLGLHVFSTSEWRHLSGMSPFRIIEASFRNGDTSIWRTTPVFVMYEDTLLSLLKEVWFLHTLNHSEVITTKSVLFSN